MRKRCRAGFALLIAISLIFTLTLIGCSKDMPAASNSNSTGDESVGSGSVISWTPDMDCSECHTKAEESKSEASFMIAHVDTSCTDCHTDADTLANTVHAGLTTSDVYDGIELVKTKVSDETCIDCHGDYTALAEKTKDVDILTDTQKTIVNPHTVTTTVNINKQHDSIGCSDCHKAHTTNPLETTAQMLCISCHHMNVYECNTCH